MTVDQESKEEQITQESRYVNENEEHDFNEDSIDYEDDEFDQEVSFKENAEQTETETSDEDEMSEHESDSDEG